MKCFGRERPIVVHQNMCVHMLYTPSDYLPTQSQMQLRAQPIAVCHKNKKFSIRSSHKALLNVLYTDTEYSGTIVYRAIVIEFLRGSSHLSERPPIRN